MKGVRGGHAPFQGRPSPHASACCGLAALRISLDGVLDQAVAVQLDVVRPAGRGHGLPYDPLCLADCLHRSLQNTPQPLSDKERDITGRCSPPLFTMLSCLPVVQVTFWVTWTCLLLQQYYRARDMGCQLSCLRPINKELVDCQAVDGPTTMRFLQRLSGSLSPSRLTQAF